MLLINISDKCIGMRGIHLIADVVNIINYELLNTVDGIKPLMKKIINDMDLHVVGEVYKQFEPIGATCLYLLSLIRIPSFLPYIP